jgi:hypothetical protein
VIQHIVLFKWRDGTTDEQVMEAFAQGREIPNEVPGVKRLTIGRNRAEADHGFTHAVSVQADSEDALHGYLVHPARKQWLEDHLRPIEADRIEIDIPVDMTLAADPRRNWEWGATAGMGPPLDDDD